MSFPEPDRPDGDQLLNCMRCGLCLPSCPTYQITGRERSSPRGRIALIRAVEEGRLEPEAPILAEEMDFCLGCLACTTACPAGVDYGSLLESARDQVRRAHPQPRIAGLAFWLFEHPWALKLAGRALWLYQRTGLAWVASKVLPKRLRELQALLPRVATRPSSDTVPAVVGRGTTKRVGMLLGCVMDFMFAQENRDTVDVLARNGCTVYTPREQGCCGALHAHAGRLDDARKLARHNIHVFESLGLDLIASNSAGCGNAMKHYGHLLKDDPEWAARAQAFAERVRDVHELLLELPWTPPTAGIEGVVTYHDACHLAHGQGVRSAPRQVLQALPGTTFVELPLADRCCGSAGTYNITHFETSMELLADKVEQIKSTGATVVGVANPGCLLQIRLGLQGSNCQAEHPMTLLAQAYSREEARTSH